MSPKLVLTLSALLSIISFPAQAKRIAPDHAEMSMEISAPPPSSRRIGIMPIRPPVIIDTQRPNNNRPNVEIAFVLDTTGSMGGLIDGAKSRIWGIINEVMERPERPNVRVGLVAYRDRGDEYVTQITPLSNNIDQVYTQLMSYQADGGGDGPEDVRSALRDGVQRLQWSNSSQKTAKIIFLVGDAPPHDDYTNLPDTLSSTRNARQRGIIINTIQCGGDSETTRIWKQIANTGNGRYFAINQNGGVKIFETPYDNQLAELSAQLDNSYIAYGSSSLRRAAKESNSKMQADIAMAAPAPAKAERAKNKAINSAAFDKQELVQSVENGEVKLEAIPTEQLPEVLQKKSLNERKTWLDEQSKARSALRAKITALSKQREAYIAAEKKKAANGNKDGFDEAVSKALKEQIR